MKRSAFVFGDVHILIIYLITLLYHIVLILRSHDYQQLLVLGGLYSRFREQLNKDGHLKADWFVASAWSEGVRASRSGSGVCDCVEEDASLHSRYCMMELLSSPLTL